jgi:hypothetical protein
VPHPHFVIFVPFAINLDNMKQGHKHKCDNARIASFSVLFRSATYRTEPVLSIPKMRSLYQRQHATR